MPTGKELFEVLPPSVDIDPESWRNYLYVFFSGLERIPLDGTVFPYSAAPIEVINPQFMPAHRGLRLESGADVNVKETENQICSYLSAEVTEKKPGKLLNGDNIVSRPDGNGEFVIDGVTDPANPGNDHLAAQIVGRALRDLPISTPRDFIPALVDRLIAIRDKELSGKPGHFRATLGGWFRIGIAKRYAVSFGDVRVGEFQDESLGFRWFDGHLRSFDNLFAELDRVFEAMHLVFKNKQHAFQFLNWSYEVKTKLTSSSGKFGIIDLTLPRQEMLELLDADNVAAHIHQIGENPIIVHSDGLADDHSLAIFFALFSLVYAIQDHGPTADFALIYAILNQLSNPETDKQLISFQKGSLENGLHQVCEIRRRMFASQNTHTPRLHGPGDDDMSMIFNMILPWANRYQQKVGLIRQLVGEFIKAQRRVMADLGRSADQQIDVLSAKGSNAFVGGKMLMVNFLNKEIRETLVVLTKVYPEIERAALQDLAEEIVAAGAQNVLAEKLKLKTE